MSESAEPSPHYRNPFDSLLTKLKVCQVLLAITLVLSAITLALTFEIGFRLAAVGGELRHAEEAASRLGR